MMKKLIKAFTLIELLIVIVIIGILATALIPRITSIQAKARDTKRLADLKQIQTALQLYVSDNNGSYPITMPGDHGGWRGECSYYNSGGTYSNSGPNSWIPNLAPEYISELPLDPKSSPDRCYLYRSDGKDYIFLIHMSVEGSIPPEYIRPYAPNNKSFAVYTPGAKMW